VRDHRVCRLEDRLGGAVVLLELDDGRVREVALELEDVPDLRAAEAVDGVVGD
jgi:hypothetical protein